MTPQESAAVRADALRSEPRVAFWWWIRERHSIYTKRQAGEPGPWTNDPVLQKYRFCNVFRELDRTTSWIRENWREPFEDHPNMPFSMAVARQINVIETLEEIGFPKTWQPERVKKIMRARKARGDKVYTSAYMLTGTLGGDKVEQTVDKILTPLKRHRWLDDLNHVEFGTLQHAHSELAKLPGFGPFMAYEVVTDLRHTDYLSHALDIMTWANAGPGAMRGLNLMFRGAADRRHPLGARGYLEEMQSLLAESTKKLPPDFPRLEMRDIEHCLCELYKWIRGSSREKFVPHK